jgi:phosphatidate cytidylyltransferase
MFHYAKQLASLLDLPINALLAGGGIAALLAVGSLIRWLRLRGSPPDVRRKHLGSLAVWWVMWGVVFLTIWAGRLGGAITFAVLSLIALREYSQLLARKAIPQTAFGIVLLSVPAMYAATAASADSLPLTLVLVAAVMLLAVRLVVDEVTAGYLATASSLAWGDLVFVYFLAHAPLLLGVPANSNPVAGPEGWFVYLIVFTESDDIFQALWGRRFGRRRITPVVSPHKTWEGLVLGGLTAIAVGAVLAPWLTPLAEPWSVSWGPQIVVRFPPYTGVVVSGVLLVLAGFFGDLNISALKRDVGVKDTGNWLPGQGGILDRLDSLTFTAPVFYYFVRLAYV